MVAVRVWPEATLLAVVWGDSHAVAMLPALNAAFASHHQVAMFAE